MSESFADTVAAACLFPSKQIQPPTTFFDPPSQQRKVAETLRRDILTSKRYILDDDVTAAAVDLGMQHPEILLAVLKNAMAPFDNMWIEWSPVAQHRASMDNTGVDSWAHDQSPQVAGVLLKRVGDSRYRIQMVGESLLETEPGTLAGFSKSQYGAGVLAIEYDIHQPLYAGIPSAAEQMVEAYTDWTKEGIRASLLAGAYMVASNTAIDEMRLEENLTDDQISVRMAEIAQTRYHQCDNLSAHAQWVFDPVYGRAWRERLKAGPDPLDSMSPRSRYYRHAVESLAMHIKEEAGVFRFVISVIALMIGRDRLAAEVVIPRGKKGRFISGKHIPFLENRRVALTVPRKIANQRMLRAVRHSMPRAQHDVEGHWKQRRKGYDINCDHVMVWETPKREVCAVHGCGFKRWRVDEFKRGDPSIGVVNKERVAQLDRKVAPIPAVAQGVYGD
jgi:hypothetical protein